jgi:hypothetical protein
VPLHLKLRGERFEFRAECIHVEAIERPFDAHKEEDGLMVLMLIGVYDIGAVSIEQARHGCDQAFPVRAVDQEYSGIRHDSESA